MTVADDNGNLRRRLDEIRSSQGDTVALDDVAEVVHSLMTTLEGDLSAADLRLHRELEALVEFIRRAHEEIAGLDPERISDEDIPNATDELDAVVAATAEATGAILDAAEEIERLAQDSDEAAAERLRGVATRIYEASNFQDITGQRITKVVNTLRHIERKVLRMAMVVRGEDVPPEEDEPPAADDGLLNGPGMPDAANSQDDIDALLASFD